MARLTFPKVRVYGATFSPCRRYRYSLKRVWDRTKPILCVIGLNPSTADVRHDDPTVRKCQHFAKAWGFGGIYMLNLFAYRATDPREMKAQEDPVGPENDRFLFQRTRGRVVLCAWGNHGTHLGRAKKVLELLGLNHAHGSGGTHEGLVCFKLTKQNQPEHPLYQPGDKKPMPVDRNLTRQLR